MAAQTSAPGLRQTDVTTTFAALTLVGPLAREVFARFSAIDLRPQITPPGALRPGSIARQPGIVICEAEDRYLMLFGWATGEYVWAVVSDAGYHLGGGPIGARRAGEAPERAGQKRVLDIFRKRRMWRRQAELKSSYDVVIVGGGSHGLATAHYLRDHGIKDVAILEKRYIGSGAAGRNTTILRSNYKTPEGARFYDASVKLYEGLSQELNFNLLFSQCGHLTLAHSDRAMFVMANRAEVNRMHGIDSRLIYPDEIKRLAPGDAGRQPGRDLPDHGRALPPARRDHPPRRGRLGPGAQRRSGRCRDPSEHRGARAWSARTAAITKVRTNRGTINAGQVLNCTAGWSTLISRHGRRAAADHDPHPAGVRDRADEAAARRRDRRPRRCTSTSVRPTAASS